MDQIWKLPPYTVDAMFITLSQVTPWGLGALGIPSLWTQTQGEGVRVGVLDTGAALQNADLIDAIEDAADFSGSRFGPLDLNGHGSHVAGTIAARDNDTGCVGIAPKCKLLIGKCLGDDGSGSSRSVAQSILWAVERKADVISMSLGSPQASQEIYEAIRVAVKAGCFVVVAAGNSGPAENSVDFPGKWPECITVGALDKNRKVAQFSSRGKEVTVCAPGVGIVSVGHRVPLVQMSGTSQATPHVAGIVALCVAKHKKDGGSTPINTPAQMKEHLKAKAIDIDTPGFDMNSGWGLVDPSKLLPVVPPPPVVGDHLTFTPDDLTPAGRAKLAAFRTAKSVTLKFE